MNKVGKDWLLPSQKAENKCPIQFVNKSQHPRPGVFPAVICVHPAVTTQMPAGTAAPPPASLCFVSLFTAFWFCSHTSAGLLRNFVFIPRSQTRRNAFSAMCVDRSALTLQVSIFKGSYHVVMYYDRVNERRVISVR